MDKEVLKKLFKEYLRFSIIRMVIAAGAILIIVVTVFMTISRTVNSMVGEMDQTTQTEQQQPPKEQKPQRVLHVFE